MPHITHFQAFLALILIFQFVWLISISVQQKELLHILYQTKDELKEIMLDFTKLQTAVTNEVTVEQSAITLITTIAGEIAASANDQQTVSDLADKLNQAAAGLSAAITANTPAAPAPVATPVVPITPVTPAQ
jgi:hypothetical protein